MADIFSKAMDWLTGEDKAKKARNKAQEIANASLAAQKSYAEQGLNAYTDYMQKALQSSTEGQDKAIAAQLAGSQAALDLARQGAAQKMSWALPTQAASLSALQALPQMQALLGMQAYNLPTSIDTSTPGSVNLAQLYKNAQQGLSTGGATGGTAGAGGTTSSYALTPYTGKTINIENSPLFNYQNKQMQENVNRALMARGYGASPAGAAILANEYAKLTANEADKTYGRLQSMFQAGAGMGGATGGEAAGTTMGNAVSGLGSNLSNIYNQAANARSGLYEQAGQTASSMYSALGNQAANVGATQAQAALSNVGKSPLYTALDLYQLYKGGTGGGYNLFGTGGGSVTGGTGGLFLPGY